MDAAIYVDAGIQQQWTATGDKGNETGTSLSGTAFKEITRTGFEPGLGRYPV